MESIKIKGVLKHFLLAVLFLSFTAAMQAQNDKTQTKPKTQTQTSTYQQTAIELTNTLSTKINLNDDQTTNIQGILVDYQQQLADMNSNEKASMKSTEELDQSINSQITEALDENQVTAFNSYKSDWWKEVRSKIHPTMDTK